MGRLISFDPELHALVRELRDACDTALDHWSNAEIRDQQLGDALEAKLKLLGLAERLADRMGEAS